MSEEYAYVGIEEMTILVIYGMPPLFFLQTKQLISLVVFLFCKIQEDAIASSCLLLATPMIETIGTSQRCSHLAHIIAENKLFSLGFARWRLRIAYHPNISSEKHSMPHISILVFHKSYRSTRRVVLGESNSA